MTGAIRRRPVAWQRPVPRELSLVGKLKYLATRRLIALPPRWQLMLAGRAPIILDGLTLDPELQLLLALRERFGVPPLKSLTPERGRARARREAASAQGPKILVRRVTDIFVDGGDGPIRARHYAPPVPDPAPLLVYLHGGGFVLCDLDTHDQACRLLSRYAGVHVLSVDYRLAPEHPFPAALEDARAALRWAFANAETLGADSARVAIGGDSAGGSLAAVTSQVATRDGGPAPVLQLLLYPAIDRVGQYPSLELFADGFFLTRDEIEWFDHHYAALADRGDPRLRPLHAEDLSGLPPAIVVTAGFDPLRDEGDAYAAALAAAGTPVMHSPKPTMIHAFMNMIDLSRSARRAALEVAEDLRAALYG